ncbi:MAG TPA: LLM class flavin-dependent oxidoreductase [Reyranella sp.]|nr:LLM class flavin-dependent oxidoreductase [Reyranella sp.]
MGRVPRLGVRLHGGLTPGRCVELATAAERLGFASVWFAENPLERGVLPALAACAAATRRVELGPGVWNPYLRHPAQIAMDIAALDDLADGRVTLGLGSGLAAPIQRLGIDNGRPLSALKDTFAIVRALLRGENVAYKGSVFSVEGAKLSFKPRRPDLPLLMAARGEQALALCGRIADGLMVSNMCPPGFARHAAQAASARRVVQYAPCAVGPDRVQATATMKPVLAGMLKTFWGLAQRVPAARTSLVTYSGIPEADFATSEPDARFLDAFTVTGDAADCRRCLAAYAEAGVTDLVLTFVGPRPIDDMAYLLRACAP